MEVFGQVRGFLNIRRDKAITDNLVFKLHYRVTFVVLTVFSFLVISSQYLGDPIDCITRDDIPNKLLDTYCWVHTTYSMDDAWDKEVGEEVPYPGIGPSKAGGKKVYHAYYQWVCWVFAIQALLFYIPHYIWKVVEGGKLTKLKLGLKQPVQLKELKDNDRKNLVEYFRENMGETHGVYFYFFAVLEVMNFINVVAQIFMMDRFLGGEFSKYGAKVLSFTEYDWKIRDDPMIRVFPRLTKCTFHRYGPSGDVTRHDAMCILPINILNEKLYVFLWFWFVILAVVSGLALLYRAAMFLLPNLRLLFLKSRCRNVDPDNLSVVLARCDMGDFMVISLLGKNMNAMNFADLIDDLAVMIVEEGPFKRPDSSDGSSLEK